MGLGQRHHHTFVPRVALLWFALVVFACALPATAQSEVTVSHAYTFGQAATFSIALSAETTVEEAKVFLEIANHTQAHDVTLDQGYGEYQRDLRENAIAPFAPVTYWWEYEDATGTKQRIEGDTFRYEDNRFDWQVQQDGPFEVKWVAGETTVMVRAIDIAQETALTIHNTLGADIPEAVSIYIYPSLADLQSALRLTGREWVGGQAYPEYGVLLLALPPSNEAILKMQRDLPHELTHKMLYDFTTPQGYATLPTWLNEGLATYYEQIPDPAFDLALEQATDAGTLIPLETLCHPFTGEDDAILLAYAQSQSFLRYLQQTHGWTGLRDLVTAYTDGLDCVSGSTRALDADLYALERDWHTWLTQENRSDGTTPLTQETVAAMTRDLAPWLLLIGIFFLQGLAFWIGTR